MLCVLCVFMTHKFCKVCTYLNDTVFISSDNKLLQASLQSGVTLRNPSLIATEQESVETLIAPEHWVSLIEQMC